MVELPHDFNFESRAAAHHFSFCLYAKQYLYGIMCKLKMIGVIIVGSLYLLGGDNLDVTMKEKYLSWGASFGIHFCILAAAAAMGLFSVVTETEKRPIDVVIYDASAPESAPEPAAEAAPPMPSIDDIPLEPPKKEQQETTQEQPKETPKPAAANTSAAPSTAQGTSEQPSPTPSTGGGEGTGRDEAAAQRPRTPPQLLSGSAPVYPPELEKKGITGTVGLAIVVGPDGGVQSVDVSSSSGQPALDQAAIAAAYTYRFEPARNIYDEPVACRVNRSFSFS